MLNYFFMGTLMDSDVAEQVLRRSLSSFSPMTATLKNYKRVYISNATYPGLVRSQGNNVEGILVQGVTLDESLLLDTFEGDEYITLDVSVEVDGGGDVSARVYAPKPSVQLTDIPWSLEDWQANEKALFLDGMLRNELV